MKMSGTDIKKYPKLAYYVRVNLPQILKVPLMVKAIKKKGNLNKKQLQRALTWGRGPQIKITRLKNAYGEFTINSKSNEIRLDLNLVKNFENGNGKRAVRSKNVYLIGITLLHELVHWGDDQNGTDLHGEKGEEFEQFVYGRIVD